MMELIYDYAPQAGLVFFFCVFVWVAVCTYRPSVKNQMQERAMIPLKGDE
jgi:cbb3-type cytochrome oxidase subunit 3